MGERDIPADRQSTPRRRVAKKVAVAGRSRRTALRHSGGFCFAHVVRTPSVTEAARCGKSRCSKNNMIQCDTASFLGKVLLNRNVILMHR